MVIVLLSLCPVCPEFSKVSPRDSIYKHLENHRTNRTKGQKDNYLIVTFKVSYFSHYEYEKQPHLYKEHHLLVRLQSLQHF